MAILLSATLALLPLTLAPGLLFYYDITPKIVVLLVGAAIGLILVWREPYAESAGLRLFGWLLTAQAASLVLSTAFSSDPALSFGGGNWRRFGLITQAALLLFAWFAAQYAAGNRDRLRFLLRVIVGAGIPAAAYGVLQYFGWDPFIDRSLYHIGEAPLTIVPRSRISQMRASSFPVTARSCSIRSRIASSCTTTGVSEIASAASELNFTRMVCGNAMP